MGAKQRGAKRGKKAAAAQGSMKGQPKSQKQLNQSILVPDLGSSSRARSLQGWGNFSGSPAAQPGFSMREEARHTDRQAHIWGETSLRSKTISFVSAGPLKRDEEAWHTVSEGESPAKQSEAEELADAAQAVESTPSLPTPEQALPEIHVAEAASQTNIAPHVEFTPATEQKTDSDSEEEIVFAGRAAQSQVPSRRPTPAPASIPIEPAITGVKGSETGKNKIIADTSSKDADAIKNWAKFATSSTIGLDSPVNVPPPEKKSKRSKLSYGRRYDSDELMQDYIDNMALDDTDEDEEAAAPQSSRKKGFKKTETFRMFNGDGLENEKVQTNGKKKPPQPFIDQAIDWDSDDLADFDDISTTDEEVEDIAQVIRHRSRTSGQQYLVVATGTEASEAKWMLHSRLISDTAVKEIKIYEEIRTMNIEEDVYDDEEDDSEDHDETDDSEEEAIRDLIDTIESEDDENARVFDYTSRMTDEQIARALAKQEELGLGSDELMIFDGEAARDTLSDDVFGANNDFVSFNLGKHSSNRTRSKRNKKQRDSFPSAEAFADALDQDPYGAFDVMDFDRPSLKPKKKGRKSDFPWDLGDLDDDLKEQLTNTWTKDREKKAERKRQREEARLTANLESEEGSDPFVIKERIRRFLLSNTDTLELSPMGSEIRRSVHMLAKTLNLLSRSKGKDGIGAGRYPVLTKTPRTPYYNADTIWEVDTLLSSKKYFPKHVFGRSKKTPRTPGSARPHRFGGGGGVMSGATYRDGDEVGASAPEIGSDNKGRALLEKMGWVAGMAIGAENNKGSLDHVRHIVKTTKAGLG